MMTDHHCPSGGGVGSILSRRAVFPENLADIKVHGWMACAVSRLERLGWTAGHVTWHHEMGCILGIAFAFFCVCVLRLCLLALVIISIQWYAYQTLNH